VLVSEFIGAPRYLVDGCIGLTSDGKGGPTNSGGLGMPRITAVWARHIDGEGTNSNRSLDASPSSFHFGKLAISPELATSVAFWLASKCWL